MCKLLQRTYVVLLCLIVSNAVNATVINGSNVFDVDGSEPWLYGYDNSTINVYAGSDVAWLYGYDNSSINVYAGSEVSWLHAYDDTNINISGGDISWLTLYDQSISNITGVEELSWLLVNDDSEVNIFGSAFSYSNGHLSGFWGDGSYFNFWALEESDLFSGSISNALPDNIRLHSVSVPEPGTVLLFFIGLVIAVYTSRLKSNRDRGLLLE